MDLHELFGFLEILKESFKIMSRNGRLMSGIATLYLLLYSLIFFFFAHSTKSLVHNLLEKDTDLSSANSLVAIPNDILILVKVDFVFLIAFFFFSLLVQTATILVSAMSYKDSNFSFKDLVLRVSRSWIRAFATSFNVTLYIIGYIFFAFAMVMIPPSMIYNRAFSYALLYLLSFLVIIFYLNFSVLWVLAIVISVIEESSGVEALGKAGGLVKGKKLAGFILSFLFALLSLAIIYGMKGMIFGNAIEMIIGVLLICAYCLMNMFQLAVFTVFYCMCKKDQGEEIELQAGMDYSKIPSLPVVNEPKPASIYKNLFKYYTFQFL